MESLKLILKLILTPFLSVSILFLTESSLFLYPLVFSIVLSLSNYDLFRFDLPFGIILGIVYSYIAFFVGYFGYGVFYKIIELIGISNDITIGEWFYTDLAFCIAVFIIAPYLTMYLQKLLFKNTKTKLTYWIISITTLAFVMISFIHSEQHVKNFFNIINFWQLIIMFGLQLVINQKVISKKIKSENKKPTHNNI
ncbi:hypothetical protein MWU58_03685 [Flavobacteriaceae bacterium S0825]|uniref:hypothetical protein n=1 Tax=Gaetbulibacter sp. S0825 TaxID=2720084 RepID=UPI001431C02C|nr:hypothetical protein [Gaetbulibacter sp. S0825]MCK0108380.1 hypothetical protein [Flavobacteriaceae bacterium S0825]NIX64016.1 hypothetical protein [Gaetbulibacter sp. S0825]